MRTLFVRNVHAALPVAMRLLKEEGILRSSRNGDVLMVPYPVATIYEYPEERVIFWPGRDANPFFHLYEAMWMLRGRNDIGQLRQYAKNIENYSDDGFTMHGAYGYRWRIAFGFDQLTEIIDNLKANPDDRRNVLGIWDPGIDLSEDSKDLPCNLTVTFQRGPIGELNMVVFNRSNDIIWGCYGANAVHFSMLQEYIASSIGCPMGTYTQVSVNWHAYTKVLNTMDLPRDNAFTRGGLYRNDPYSSKEVVATRLDSDQKEMDHFFAMLLKDADEGFAVERDRVFPLDWMNVFYNVLLSWQVYKEHVAPENFDAAQAQLMLPHLNRNADWVIAASEWFQRRRDKWEVKQVTLGEA